MSTYTFPKNFIWGAATASHQVEGSNTANDWAAQEQTGKIPPAGIACDSWRKHREDIALAVRLGLNSYRFSLEWSRLQPTYDSFDESAARYYRTLVDDLKAHHIKPMITINHFTLPQWFYDQGGWLAPESADVFDAFVLRVATIFEKSEVPYWLTINEPTVYAYKAYMEGAWPPFEKNYAKARLALMNLKAAHAKAYTTLKRFFPRAQVSYAHHYRWFKPCDRSGWYPLNLLAAKLRSAAFNDDFLRWAVRDESLDFIALNYYTGEFTTCTWREPFGKECSCHQDEYPRTSLGWAIRPAGLYEALAGLNDTGLPIMVTENGISTADDALAEIFVKEHLRAIARAMRGGADVRGYFYWSLLDNYEWAEGYAATFGLADRSRSEKQFAGEYAKMIANNSIVM